VSASVKSSHSGSTPKLAFILGVALVVLPVGMMHFIRGGATGAKAVEVARTQYGEAISIISQAWAGRTGMCKPASPHTTHKR
jgi:hypothetical protein